jgi:hypothetical protein
MGKVIRMIKWLVRIPVLLFVLPFMLFASFFDLVEWAMGDDSCMMSANYWKKFLP